MIDPRISLMAQTANVSPAINTFMQAREQQRQLGFDPLRKQQMELANQESQQRIGLNEQTSQANQQALAQGKQLQDLQTASQLYAQTKPAFESGDPEAIKQSIMTSTIPDEDKAEMVQLVDNGQVDSLKQVLKGASEFVTRQTGGGPTASMKERENLLRDAASDDPEVAKSAKIALGLAPRASGSAAITIAEDEGLTEKVAKSQAEIAGKKESKKIDVQTAKLPKLNSIVKKAEILAKKKGEVFTDLNRMQAALPELKDVVANLGEIAPIVTSTIGGKVFDFASKELGFGTTKGANARAKFQAIVDNQVLPLLKPTFGAAFTVAEGEALKATLGDPDASPAQKMEQLKAFIDQKERDIVSTENELKGLGVQDTESQDFKVIKFDSNGNMINGN